MALVAPELILTWAARQFFSARETAIEFNITFGAQPREESTATLLTEIPRLDDRNSAPTATGRKFTGWTVTHGFFAWMGGFLLYVNDEPRATLSPDELRTFVRDGSVDMPDIVQAEIEDRSKGDALSKGIAILQLAWFVLQLVARYAQNLPITLLEIDTLAVAALTSTAYGWWWKKPKDVGRPSPVYWKAAASPRRDLAYDRPHTDLNAGGGWYYFAKLFYPFMSLMGLDSLVSPGAVRSRRVPSLAGYIETRNGTILLIGCLSGMVFGGIHCAAWNFLFQRHAEQVLWRAASLVILCSPISFLISYMFEWNGWLVVVVILASFAYIAARLTLIVLILLSLQSLPPGVYDTVAWTRFIPHL